MKCFFRSIIACICGLTIVFSSAVPPVFARDGVIGDVVDGVQSFTEWGVNNLNNFWKVIFGPDFNSASEEELKAAYDNYVETLPASGYNSDGSLLYSPTPYYLYYRKQGGALGSTHVWGCPHWEALGDNRKASLTGLKAQFSCFCADCAFIVSPQDGASSYEGVSGTIYSYYLLIAPIDGYYTPLNDIAATGRFVSSSQTENFVVPYSGSEAFYSRGQRVEIGRAHV